MTNIFPQYLNNCGSGILKFGSQLSQKQAFSFRNFETLQLLSIAAYCIVCWGSGNWGMFRSARNFIQSGNPNQRHTGHLKLFFKPLYYCLNNKFQTNNQINKQRLNLSQIETHPSWKTVFNVFTIFRFCIDMHNLIGFELNVCCCSWLYGQYVKQNVFVPETLFTSYQPILHSLPKKGDAAVDVIRPFEILPGELEVF